MSLQLWRLPGPRTWLEAVLADVDEGAFVVCRFPAPLVTNDLFDAAQRERSYLYMEHVEAREGQSLSDVVLAEEPGAMSVDEALQRLADAGTLLWIVTRNHVDPEELTTLAEKQRHASDSPPAMVVEHSGRGSGAKIRPAPALRVHHFYGAIGSLDVQVFIDQTVPRMSSSRKLEIAELAAFDLELARRLAIIERPTHEKFGESCLERASELGLVRPVREIDPAAVPLREPRAFADEWATGTFEMVDGAPTIHSGVLSAREVSRRLWRGQVRAILPFLDEMRLELITVLARMGIATSPERGEVVELVDVARAFKRARLDPALTHVAFELTRARNDLAHLRPITEERRAKLREAMRGARLNGGLSF